MPVVTAPGSRYRFHIRDDHDGIVSDTALIRETWTENVYQIHRHDFVGTGATGLMVDLGANIGIVSTYAAAMGASVIAVEPQRGNIELLHENLAENAVADQVTVIPLGVHRNSGPAHITDARGNSQIIMDADYGLYASTPTRVLSLLDLFNEYGIDECDVLKIDIEGAEYALIDGADIETLRRAKYLTLEFDNTIDLQAFGAMIAKICCGFNTHTIGSPLLGGYVYARRY